MGKKVLSIVLMAIMLINFFAIVPIVSVSATEEKYLFGDLNYDGQIDVVDLTVITNYLNGSSALTDEQQVLADVNGNGQVDMDDRQSIIDNNVYGTTFPIYSKLIDYGYYNKNIDPYSDPPVLNSTVKYMVKTDGTLTIFGEGEMGYYYVRSNRPWYNYRQKITKVEVRSGVCSLGNGAFSGLSNLKTVNLANSITIIQACAFESCSSLESIHLPNSITEIRDNAFIESGLKNIEIPNSVTRIDRCAFYDCHNLENVTISGSVTYLGYDMFLRCYKLKSIVVDSNNSNYSSLNGSLYNKNKTEIIQYPLGKSDTSFIVPNSVSVIGSSAFSYSRLVSVEIPDGVTTIYDAFYNCSNLTSVTISNSVKYISNNAFNNCSSNLVIYGFQDSYSETYANNNGITFIPIDTDTTKPTVSLSSTNGVVVSQTVTISLSDNVGIKGYYWGTNSSYSNNYYTSTSSTSVSKTVDSAGTYYATAVDTSGNVSSTVSITFYKTTLNANGGSVSPTSVLTKSGNSFTFPTPTRSNYTYVGWSTYSSATSGVKSLSPSSNATYYAVWSYVDSQKPTASLSSTNNIASSQTVTIGLSDNVGIKGYYWGTSSSYSNNTYTITSNTSISKTVDSAGTYYATAVDTSGNVSSTVSITLYKTTLNANGGSVSPTSVLTKSGNSFTFPTPTRSNYTYVGWSTYSSATSGVKTISPSSNATYYAVWSYVDSQKPTASLSSTNNVASSQTVTISMSDNVGIKGYYWGISSSYSNNTYTTTSNTSISKTVDSAGTYYATAVDTSGNVSATVSISFYKTTLNANGGSVSPTSVLTKSGNSFTFPTPTRSSYTYVGWSTSSSATSGVKTLSPSSNATYYAVWSYVDSQKPTASLLSTNNVASSQTVTIGMSDNVGIKGYYWGTSSTYSNNSYTSTSNTSISKTVDSAGTYYATAVDTSGNVSSTVSITFYKTTLNANGGSVSPTSVLTKSGNSFTFPTPIRSNYTYVGWSTSSSATSGVKTLSPSTNDTYYTIWKSNNLFVWGQDNWNFNNNTWQGYFKESTYRAQINSTYLNKLKNNLTNSEYQAIFTGYWYYGEWCNAWLDDWWGGSCYGMSSLALLSKEGVLPYSSYKSSATKLHDLNYPKADSNVSSLVTYYQMLQVKDVIQQQYGTVKYRSNETNIKNIIELLDVNSTVLVGFQKKGWGGHAILAIGYEYGSWTWNGVAYQGCIKICDPNCSISYNNSYNIYFNTQSYNWTIPAYSGIKSVNGAVFNYIGSNVDEINCGGFLSGTSTNKIDNYIARIDAVAISDNRSVTKVVEKNGSYVIQNSAPGDIIEDYSYVLGNESEGTIGYNLFDANASYKVSQPDAQELQLIMNYDNCYLSGGSRAGSSVIFNKNGYIQVEGETADYNMTMTFDDSYPTDWFTLAVSGETANSASLTMVDDGYVLFSDNLKNVNVRANNKDNSASTTFSTDYDSVFIYEIDENTIGLKVDADGNGTYETELPTSQNNYKIGDTNLDGIISISDVTAIQRHLAELSRFTEEQLVLADTNGDGSVDITDATHLQKYLAEFDGVVLGKQNN